MTAISQKLPNLIGGVSQQPDTLKFSNQFRSCDNYYPDLTFGLAKRPGIEARSRLVGAVDDGTWFTMFKDEKERYLVQFTKTGGLAIWDAETGEPEAVNPIAGSAASYATHTLNDDLALFQINDYTFVINRKKIVKEKTSAVSPSITPFGIAVISVFSYNTPYEIVIDGISFSVTSAAAAPSSGSALASSLVAAINANPNYFADSIGNVIYVKRVNNADFSFKVEGGLNNTAIEGFKGSVPLAAKLPQQFFNNLKIKVEANPESEIDDYWVQFETANGSSEGAGKWVECIAPDVVERLDETTMPHAIIREADGTFTFRLLDKASAAGSTPIQSISGIVTGISITNSPKQRYTVGQIFNVTTLTPGSLGTGLRLIVTKTKSVTTSTNYNYPNPQGNYVTLTFTGLYQALYEYYENGVKIASGANLTSFSPYPGKTYTKYGTGVGGPNNAIYFGLTISTTTSDLLDEVSVYSGGQNYAVSNVVKNKFGDTFTVTAVTTTDKSADVIVENYWKYRTVGDDETNPMPSFVGRPIHGISFFRNRLVLLSGENVICSQVGDYFDFFLSTVLTTVEDDVIDIACGSIKPVELRYAVPAARGLALFSPKSQYLLTTTTDAFSSRSAEINLISQYEMDEDIAPFDTGSSIVFTKKGDKATNIYEMVINPDKAEVVELTRTIPSYIPNAVSYLTGSSSSSTFALITPQKSNEIYLFRYFNAESRVMSSWFKWTVPGIIVSMTFDHDVVYLVTKQDNDYVLGTINLLTESPGGAVLFNDKYVDLRLDFFTYKPIKVYLPATDQTKICFKVGFANQALQPVLVSLDEDDPGNAQELEFQKDLNVVDEEQYFVLVDGDQTSKEFGLGYKYEAVAELPAFYFVQEEGRKDTLNIPTVHRIYLNSYESGPFKVNVNADNRSAFSLSLPQEIANLYNANVVPMLTNAQSTIPIMAKGTQVKVFLVADGPFPTAFTSLNWEGTYNNKGIRG